MCFLRFERNQSVFLLLVFSNDEDDDQHSTDAEGKEKGKDKKNLCKVKWSRDEVSLKEQQFPFHHVSNML